MMFKRKGEVKGLLNNVQKTALFLEDGIPYLYMLYPRERQMEKNKADW